MWAFPQEAQTVSVSTRTMLGDKTKRCPAWPLHMPRTTPYSPPTRKPSARRESHVPCSPPQCQWARISSDPHDSFREPPSGRARRTRMNHALKTEKSPVPPLRVAPDDSEVVVDPTCHSVRGLVPGCNYIGCTRVAEPYALGGGWERSESGPRAWSVGGGRAVPFSSDADAEREEREGGGRNGGGQGSARGGGGGHPRRRHRDAGRRGRSAGPGACAHQRR